MLYNLLILIIILLFCTFMQIVTVKVVFSMFNAMRSEGTHEIKPILPKKAHKKTKSEIEAEEKARREQEILDTISHNIDVYDGTELGQEEV